MTQPRHEPEIALIKGCIADEEWFDEHPERKWWARPASREEMNMRGYEYHPQVVMIIYRASEKHYYKKPFYFPTPEHFNKGLDLCNREERACATLWNISRRKDGAT